MSCKVTCCLLFTSAAFIGSTIGAAAQYNDAASLGEFACSHGRCWHLLVHGELGATH